jgi:hypothetical protein
MPAPVAASAVLLTLPGHFLFAIVVVALVSTRTVDEIPVTQGSHLITYRQERTRQTAQTCLNSRTRPHLRRAAPMMDGVVEALGRDFRWVSGDR